MIEDQLVRALLKALLKSLRTYGLLLFLLLFLPLLGAGSSSAGPGPAAQLAQPLAEWNGQYFDKKQGGVFTTLALTGFSRTVTTNIIVYIDDILQRKSYQISLKPNNSGPLGGALTVWLAPSGKYLLKQIVMVDGAGTKRSWSDASGKTTLIIRRQCLSNLGEWRLQPAGRDGLKVDFKTIPNPYKEDSPKSQSSIVAVFDGFSGLLQEAFGGKKVLQGSATGFGNARELRQTITFTRQISMFFKLDLLRQNRFAKSVADVLTTYDANMRKCYTDRLDFNDDLRGEVRFTFLLAKASGTMIKVKSTGGTIADPKLSECLFMELSHMQFSVAENLVGELIYTYDVK